MVWVVVGLVAVPSCLLLDFGCGSRAVSLLAPPCWEWGGKMEGGGGGAREKETNKVAYKTQLGIQKLEK